MAAELNAAADLLRKGSGSNSFWLIFLLCQSVFVAVFLFYKRATDFKDKKLL